VKGALPRLHPEDLKALAAEIVVQLRPAMADADPEMTREEAAAYCRISVREFDRERERHEAQLKPARTTRPLLWRRSTLDCYRALRGGFKKAS
jgi:hypothetical protein